MPKRLSLVVAVVVASLFHMGPATAQTTNPELIAAAKELVTVMRMADQIKTMVPMIMNAIKPAIVQNRPEVAKDYDALVPEFAQLMISRADGFVAGMATVYARNFTVAQLREITDFYRTPTGKAMLEKQPVLAQEGLEVGQRFGASLAGELQTRIRSELRKKGHNI
jgi:hypothetical protein